MQPEMLKKVIISGQSSGTVRVWISPGRLEDVGAGLGHPVVLEIVPAALDDVAMHRRGMEVPGQDAGACARAAGCTTGPARC